MAEVPFQTVKSDLVRLNGMIENVQKQLTDKTGIKQDYSGDDMKELLNNAAYLAAHIGQAAELMDGPKPTSMSVPIGKISVNWNFA